ncbi:MAG: DUF2796 domain-containing protein [Usitatibacter sp.]
MKLRHAVVFGAAWAVASAQAAPPHVHGIAALDVAFDGKSLQLTLDSPLENLVGFEHAPANAREEQAIRAMVRRFARAEELFAPSSAAHCSLKAVRLSSPVIDAKVFTAEGVSAAAPGESHEEAGHADLDASIEFSCQRPSELKAVEAKIFAVFPGLHRIDAQIVTPARQSAATATTESRMIAF